MAVDNVARYTAHGPLNTIHIRPFTSVSLIVATCVRRSIEVSCATVQSTRMTSTLELDINWPRLYDVP